MPTIALPIVFSTKENRGFLKDLESRISKKSKDPEDANILLQYPVVYVHYWRSNKLACSYEDKRGIKHDRYKYYVYVGESNDVVQRTKQHYEEGTDSSKWQYKLVNSKEIPNLIVVGHEHFNKSLTLDVENQLREYILSMGTVERIFNGRGNPQNNYYTAVEFEEIFRNIWQALHDFDKDFFLPESTIKDSSLFKMSPFKKLTHDQIDAKNKILSTISKALQYEKSEGQLIFVQGEAGTGKTVLTANLFYELVQMAKDLSCHLIVNHNEQLRVYEQITKRLDLRNGVVSKPASFIHSHKPAKKVDISFVDEGHLLLTQGTQGYSGKNQLDDIIKRSKVTVVMFDEYQILTTQQFWEAKDLNKFKKKSIKQDNYITLTDQLRMHCAQSTRDWLNAFVLNRTITKFKRDKKYEVKSFDTPQELQSAIEAKAKVSDTRLSRLVATYDWEYKGKRKPSSGGSWGVSIGEWFMPWNYELEKGMDKNERKNIKNLAWAEQEQTLGEVGSTFTIQGFDLSYVGVILGPAVKYRRGRIVYDPRENKYDLVTRHRTLRDGSKVTLGKMFIRNEVKVLMSRGVSGLYIYAVDDELRAALKNIAKI